MNRVILAALLSAVFISCAQNKTKLAPPPKQAYALVSELRVQGRPAAMPDASRVAMEATSIKIVAGGPMMLRPILQDIATNRDPNRQFVLLKLFVMILDNMSDGPDKDAYDKLTKAESERLLKAPDPSDRRVGLDLAALPRTSLLVPASINMLEDKDASNREFAIMTLTQIARMDLGYSPGGTPEARKAAVKRWKKWWRGNKEQELYYSHTPGSNPVIQSLTGDLDAIARTAGPFALTVIDKATGKGVAGAVVAYSYHFTTFDGQGLMKEEHATTDESGKLLMAAKTVAAGQKYVGAELIVSKKGCKQASIRLLPHILTPNSFSIEVALEPEAE